MARCGGASRIVDCGAVKRFLLSTVFVALCGVLWWRFVLYDDRPHYYQMHGPQPGDLVPNLDIVDTTDGLEMIRTAGHDHGDHHHSEIDPHVWLSPQRLRIQAATIARTLERLDPDAAPEFRTAAAIFDQQLITLDTEITDILAPVAGHVLLAFHPAFGYLAADYGLIQSAVETGGMAPGPKGLAKVLQRAKASGVQAVFVQPQFSMSAARAVAAEIGVELVMLDPLARDTVDNLRAMALTIREVLDDQ